LNFVLLVAGLFFVAKNGFNRIYSNRQGGWHLWSLNPLSSLKYLGLAE
jgi:hypothetical protein